MSSKGFVIASMPTRATNEAVVADRAAAIAQPTPLAILPQKTALVGVRFALLKCFDVGIKIPLQIVRAQKLYPAHAEDILVTCPEKTPAVAALRGLKVVPDEVFRMRFSGRIRVTRRSRGSYTCMHMKSPFWHRLCKTVGNSENEKIYI
jgi:hypothetical protein